MMQFTLYERVFREQVLNADWMVAEMLERAEQGAEFARSIAPVDENGPHPGRYRESISAEAHTHGGIHGDRAVGVVRATAPESLYVEYGTEHSEGQHVLHRALDVMG